MKYKSTLETWNGLANVYRDRFMDFDLYDDTYDSLCDMLRLNSQIVEIGCGPGNITRYLLGKRPDLKILSTDFAPNMVEMAQNLNPAATFQVLDARDIATLDAKFDAVVCGFCLPYLNWEECLEFIRDAAKVLVSNGLFYLSVIEDDYQKSGRQFSSDGKNSNQVYYYSETDLDAMLKQSGFENVQVFRKAYPSNVEKTDTHLILIARLIC